MPPSAAMLAVELLPDSPQFSYNINIASILIQPQFQYIYAVKKQSCIDIVADYGVGKLSMADMACPRQGRRILKSCRSIPKSSHQHIRPHIPPIDLAIVDVEYKLLAGSSVNHLSTR